MRTLLIFFTRDGKGYRMRVAAHHLHPGERDQVEVVVKDLMGASAWRLLPDDYVKVVSEHRIPSPEWLVRRALWEAATPSTANVEVIGEINVVTIHLGEI